jgi:anaerobic selenocysteine-containing dehydrogenase
MKLIARDGPLTRGLVRAGAPDVVLSSVCGFCSTGCSLDVHLRAGAPTTIRPSAGYPVNLGNASPKGWEALTPLAASDRATVPLVRRDGRLRPVDWSTALHTVVDGFKSVQARHGDDAVAWLGTGQVPTEELALLGSVAKFGMGIVHGDGNTRQCMATSVVAYKQSFGFDAPPYTYADLEESDVVVLVGSNLAIAHPILWDRLRRNRQSPSIVVVDPRRTETAMAATHHVPLAPKSDLVLLYGLGHLLVRDGYVDHGFIAASTTGFDEYVAHVAAFPPSVVSKVTGLPVAQLEELASLIGRAGRASFWWTMGVNQGHESTRTAQAIIDLALLTGNIGRPGTGANSITGQCNAMGSRLFSNTVSLLGGRDFPNADHRAEVAQIMDLDVGRIPDRMSLAYDQIIEGVHRGSIKALWIVATNTAHSWIDRGFLDQVRGNLDLLVVQDMYASTETARLADVVLPAAGWGEKDGTFINSERRIGRVRRVAAAPGDARPDFWIFQALADAWGCGDLFSRWSSPAAAFDVLRELSRGRPCDFTGIRGYADLDAGGIQWPHPSDAVSPPEPERRLFADGVFFHPDGRARFIVDDPVPVPEAVDARYPFVLLTGRGSSAEWHTGTRTSKSAMLRSLAPTEPHLELSPIDAERLGIAPEDWVIVRSRRGSAKVRAFVTTTVQPGQVFLPMHHASTNLLTLARFDPHSRQPSYKHCAVSVTRPEAWE